MPVHEHGLPATGGAYGYAQWLARWLVPGCVALGLVACGDRSTAAPGAFQTVVAEGVAATLTAAAAAPALLPSATPSASLTASPAATMAATARPPAAEPTQETPAPIPSPARPTSAFFTDARYELAEEHLIGRYAVRIWENVAGRSTLMFDRVLTIAAADEQPVQVEFVSGLHELTGSDITGDGTPEVIVETYSGGAHCCLGTVVISLGDQPERIMDRPASNCGGEFRDLDEDGALEFVTCDDLFAYRYCPYAASPVVTVVLAYQPGDGYQPASPRFPDLYTEMISQHRELAEQAQPGALGEWDATTKCAVLPLVLDYLYSGRPQAAWEALRSFYNYADVENFRREIESTARQSPLFTSD